MRIIQIMPTVAFGDAVSNDAVALSRVISDMGYKTSIYAENIDKRLKNEKVRKLSQLPSLDKDDIVIFNHSTGTELCYKLPAIGGRKMMIYHNITPPRYFAPYNVSLAEIVNLGYKGTEFLADKIEFAMADSAYNADDLKRMGYKCPIAVRPILIPFEDYEKKPDEGVIAKYKGDGFVNIVFVGRIAPNKMQESVIAAFAYYKNHFNARSRLFLVGSDNCTEMYSKCLREYTDALRLSDNVIFTGQVSFKEIIAYYRIADAFLCMSDHEGFCVPLVESMFFDVPVIAYDSSAVGDTLGGSGLLSDTRDPVFVASLMNRLLTDDSLKEYVISKQRERLKDFAYDKVKGIFVGQMTKFIEKEI